MTSKKKPAFNYQLKALFESLKKSAGVTSKDIAEALDVSQQTVTTISGKLDTLSVSDMVLMAEALKTDPERFMLDIMTLSEIKTQYYIPKKD